MIATLEPIIVCARIVWSATFSCRRSRSPRKSVARFRKPRSLEIRPPRIGPAAFWARRGPESSSRLSTGANEAGASAGPSPRRA